MIERSMATKIKPKSSENSKGGCLAIKFHKISVCQQLRTMMMLCSASSGQYGDHIFLYVLYSPGITLFVAFLNHCPPCAIVHWRMIWLLSLSWWCVGSRAIF